MEICRKEYGNSGPFRPDTRLSLASSPGNYINIMIVVYVLGGDAAQNIHHKFLLFSENTANMTAEEKSREANR